MKPDSCMPSSEDLRDYCTAPCLRKIPKFKSLKQAVEWFLIGPEKNGHGSLLERE